MNIRAIILCGALSAAGYLPAAETLTNQFQRALVEEEANQNLTNAIAGYEAVIKGLDEQRPLAATAVFRLGECYRKLGRTNDAVAAYQRVVTEFSDQETLVKLSRQNLSILQPTPEIDGDEYVIKPGDSLAKIAAAYGTTSDRLLELNPGLDARRLRVGDRIRIKSSADYLRELMARQTRLRALELGLLSQYTPEYPLVVQVRKELKEIDDQIENARTVGPGTPDDSTNNPVAAELGRLEVLLATVKSMKPMSAEEIRTLNLFANDPKMIKLLDSFESSKSRLRDAEAQLAAAPEKDLGEVAYVKRELDAKKEELSGRRNTALRMLEARIEAARRLAGQTSTRSVSLDDGSTLQLQSLSVERDRLRATLDQIDKISSKEDLIAMIQTLMPDPQLSKLGDMIIEAKAKLASLKPELGADNSLVRNAQSVIDSLQQQEESRSAAVLNAAKARLQILDQLISKNSDSTQERSILDPAARAKEKELLEQEIALAQEQLKEDQKRIEMGMISTEDSIPHQLDLLELKRKLAALEIDSESMARQKDFLEEEIKLVDRLIASAQVRIQNGKGSSSELRDIQRQKLQLQRERIDLDRAPAVASAETAPTPAMTADEAEELRRVQALVANSPDLINRLSGDPSDYPLRRAAQKGWLNVVDFLLKHGAKTEVSLNGTSPLQAAANAGHLTVVASLIRAGADLDRHTAVSPTPLVAACWKNYEAVANALIQAGANVNIASGTSSGNQTPLYSPLALAGLEISRQLLEHGALPDGAPGSEPPIVRAGDDTAKLDLLLAHHAKPGLTNNAGETALFAAATSSNLTNVTRLLNLGLDPNARDSSGKPVIQNPFLAALDSAYSAEIRDRNWAVVKKLIEGGVDPNTKLVQASNQSDPQQILLHVAAFRGDMQAIQFLLDKGADVNAKAADGHTPLHLAAVGNHVDVIKLLLEHHAEVNAADQYGDTPLHFAAMAKSLEAARALIDAGADRNAKDKGGYTPKPYGVGSYYINSTGVPGVNPSGSRNPVPNVTINRKAPASDNGDLQKRIKELQSLLSDPAPSNAGKAPAPKAEPR